MPHEVGGPHSIVSIWHPLNLIPNATTITMIVVAALMMTGHLSIATSSKILLGGAGLQAAFLLIGKKAGAVNNKDALLKIVSVIIPALVVGVLGLTGTMTSAQNLGWIFLAPLMAKWTMSFIYTIALYSRAQHAKNKILDWMESGTISNTLLAFESQVPPNHYLRISAQQHTPLSRLAYFVDGIQNNLNKKYIETILSFLVDKVFPAVKDHPYNVGNDMTVSAFLQKLDNESGLKQRLEAAFPSSHDNVIMQLFEEWRHELNWKEHLKGLVEPIIGTLAGSEDAVRSR